MKKTFELLNLDIKKMVIEEKTPDKKPQKDKIIKEEKIIEKIEKFDYPFFTVYPIEYGKDEDNKIKEGYNRNSETYIRAIDRDNCILCNADRIGNVFENEIELKNNMIIIEAHDPQAYNIAIYVPKGERYKHSLQSRELSFILEFYNQTRGNVWLKYEDKNLIKL